MHKLQPCWPVWSVITLFLLTHLAVAEPAKSPEEALEIYLHGERPIGSHSNQSEAVPLELAMPRNSYETILVRLNFKQNAENLLVPRDIQFKVLKTNIREANTAYDFGLNSYWIGSHHFSQSSYSQTPSGEVLDIAVPLEIASQKSFKIRSQNVPSKPAYLFEVHATSSALPQALEGVIKFKLGSKDYLIPFHLKVFKSTLPSSSSLKTSFGWDPTRVMNKHFGKWDDSTRELNQKYFALASEHRIDLHKIYMKFPDKMPEESDPDYAKYDPLVTSASPQDSFMAQWAPLISGATMPDQFSWSMTDLPVPEDQKKFSKKNKKKHENFWEKLNESVRLHLLEKSSFVYFADEPPASQLKEIGESLREIRKWAPNLSFLITKHFVPELDGGVTIWAPNLSQWDQPGFPSPEFYRERQRSHHENLWLYTSCNAHGCNGPEDNSIPDLVTDRKAAYARVLPWVAARYGADGILYYDTVYGYDSEKPESPWQDSFAFTGYGEGNLFYPCNKIFCGTEEQLPLASLRLKSLRDGLQDYEVITLGRKAGLPVDQWIKDMIPSVREFPKDTARYDVLRVRVLKALEK